MKAALLEPVLRLQLVLEGHVLRLRVLVLGHMVAVALQQLGGDVRCRAQPSCSALSETHNHTSRLMTFWRRLGVRSALSAMRASCLSSASCRSVKPSASWTAQHPQNQRNDADNDRFDQIGRIYELHFSTRS